MNNNKPELEEIDLTNRSVKFGKLSRGDKFIYDEGIWQKKGSGHKALCLTGSEQHIPGMVWTLNYTSEVTPVKIEKVQYSVVDFYGQKEDEATES